MRINIFVPRVLYVHSFKIIITHIVVKQIAFYNKY